MSRVLESARSCLAIIGGRLEPDNAPIFAQIGERAGGRLAVLATASQLPHEVGPETVADFRRHGVDAELVPLFHGNAGTAAKDPRIAAQVRRLGAVYFTGGDQSTLVRALAPGGRETPVLAAIRELHAAGGLIAGSSAGAAVMSAQMIIGGNSLEAAIHGITDDADKPGLLLGRGFGFFPYGVVDQHFLQRGRIGRLIVAMAHGGARCGFGVDENTAMFVDGHMLSVVGETGAIVVNGSLAVADARHRRYDDYKVSYLDDGDAYNLAEHLALANSAKKPARKSASRGFTESGYLERSVFAPHVFDELLKRLAEGDSGRYARDTATSYDADAQIEVTLELKRSAVSSDSRVARAGKRRRYSVFGYGLSMRCRALAPEARKEWLARHTKQLMRGVQAPREARLIAIGARLDEASAQLLADLRALGQPLTVVAAA
ncbi:MAG: cyanophycinase, partial [Gammaproteobacteria bacterium]